MNYALLDGSNPCSSFPYTLHSLLARGRKVADGQKDAGSGGRAEQFIMRPINQVGNVTKNAAAFNVTTRGARLAVLHMSWDEIRRA